ncbi:sulfatase-like hydrolase/transferase [Flammeovirga kamogawensis]|uniref:Sulfatase-like hydrolase/transferase n=1 Tax=Flammeovirga kamogawensis TaxID=373891 RepID=A0ABX8H3Q7_9BACT|nr:sulfatase-like hydrolase/transferase [Flammeovirga kamogawensis]MBB6460454.1 arylsulfatase A-like enzyme [Flammeovirga kamogawensis]QWG10259.1 sulfatase-like hydrolase/transferase [Flammeovirga kamogawensis]
MTRIICHILTFLSFFLLLTPYIQAQEEGNKTNLLFIITDQQRFDAIGKAGEFDFLQTPTMDKLADEGAYFTNAYTPCAVCAPARTVILTGQTVENNGVRKNDFAYNDPNEENYCEQPSFDQVLIEKGYYGEYIGKYHSPIHLAEGYSEFGYDTNASNIYTLQDKKEYNNLLKSYANENGIKIDEDDLLSSFFKNFYTPDPIDSRYQKGEDFKREDANGNLLNRTQPDEHGKLNLPQELSLTNFQTQKVRAALERASQQEKPFNITISYFFPHAPMLPTAQWYQMYPLEDMPMPESIHDNMANSPYINSNKRTIMPEYSDPNKVKYMMSNYFGLISEIDHYLGSILEDLEDYGMDENTLIIFTSDHGEMLGGHGMREKNVFFEESAHIPLIIWHPGKIKPTKVESPVSLIDLYPTIMDYLDIDTEQRDGNSLRGVIEKNETRDYAVTEWDYNGNNQPNYMVITDDGWKLITSYNEKNSTLDALYNLNDDPHEMINLLGSNPDRFSYKAQVDRLQKYLVEWLEDKSSARTSIIKNKVLLSSSSASFISQTVPHTLTSNAKQEVYITFQNRSNETWEINDKFVLENNTNTAWVGTKSITLDKSIAPLQSHTFSFEITAPSKNGLYDFQWKLKNQSSSWGEVLSPKMTLSVGNVSEEDNQLSYKMMMGYQGWFLAKGDNSGFDKWKHWFTSSDNSTADDLGFDYYPDMSEYTDTYPIDMTMSNGEAATVFSSHDLSTTQKHFEWMKNYGIYGVYLQRFLNPLSDQRMFKVRNDILDNVKTAAVTHDRHFAVMYDLSGVADDGELFNKLITDWEYIVDEHKILEQQEYVLQNGKPVIGLWGVGFKDRGLKVETFQKIIDYFHKDADPKYQAYIVGGVPDGWRTLSRSSATEQGWADIYRQLDMLSPWSVGRYNNDASMDKWNQEYIQPDLEECNTQNIDYMPVVWPGFSWLNIKQGGLNQIPRNGGEFYWKQVYNALEAGNRFLYVAMFDEVDEGTAMFKMVVKKEDLPVEAQERIVTLDMDGYPCENDWYLRLAGASQKMLEGKIDLSSHIPISYAEPIHQAEFIDQELQSSIRLKEKNNVSISMKNTGTTTWTATDFHLQNIGDLNWKENIVFLEKGEVVPPNQTKNFEFAIEVKEGVTEKEINFQWQMFQNDSSFGDQTENVVMEILPEDILNSTENALIELNVFPNPTNGNVINIHHNFSASYKELPIAIYNLQGQLLYHSNIKNTAKIQLPIPSKLPHGMYYLRVGKAVIKFIHS